MAGMALSDQYVPLADAVRAACGVGLLVREKST
jgi:hypothetical protein